MHSLRAAQGRHLNARSPLTPAGSNAYLPPDALDQGGLYRTLSGLHLLADDPRLNTLAHDLAVEDHVLTEIEWRALAVSATGQSAPPAADVSPPDVSPLLVPRSRAWIDGLHEVLAHWRSRAADVVTAADSGTLLAQLNRLKASPGPDAAIALRQIERVIDDPALAGHLWLQIQHMEIPRAGLTRLRACFHAYAGDDIAVQEAARVNPHCGALEYSAGGDKAGKITLNRRDIADALRALDFSKKPPTLAQRQAVLSVLQHA